MFWDEYDAEADFVLEYTYKEDAHQDIIDEIEGNYEGDYYNKQKRQEKTRIEKNSFSTRDVPEEQVYFQPIPDHFTQSSVEKFEERRERKSSYKNDWIIRTFVDPFGRPWFSNIIRNLENPLDCITAHQVITCLTGYWEIPMSSTCSRYLNDQMIIAFLKSDPTLILFSVADSSFVVNTRDLTITVTNIPESGKKTLVLEFKCNPRMKNEIMYNWWRDNMDYLLIIESNHNPKFDKLCKLLEKNLRIKESMILKNFYCISQNEERFCKDKLWKQLSFELKVLIEILITRNLARYHLISKDQKFVKIITTWTKQTHDAIVYGLKELIDHQISSNYGEKMISFMKNYRKDVGSNVSMIQTVIITPTKVFPQGLQREDSNRVLRQHSNVRDRFLRVSFRNEQFRKIFELDKHSYNRILSAMIHGLSFCDRDYKFLAFSGGQLHNHTCWFFSETKEITVDGIRKWMGNFDEIKSPANYAARMGQCLSTSIDTVKVQGDIYYCDDIERNGCVFTDGIGLISTEYAKKIFPSKENISAFQIRFQGYKGMLVVHPIHTHDVIFRPSMEKFESNHSTIEVTGSSQFISKGNLNRDLIGLLSLMEVNENIFLKLNMEMITKFEKMVISKEHAIAYLNTKRSKGMYASLISAFQRHENPLQEPFLLFLMKLMSLSEMHSLKFKPKIPIEKSRTAYGVIDELGVLKEGEVFFSFLDGFRPRVLAGKVMLCRSPVVHTGAIRMIKAVDHPDLHYLRNVIVFSQFGDRSLPSEMQGDLDGDKYMIIWDSDLFPEKSGFPLPINTKPMEKVDQVNMSDIGKFFVEYIENDQLGRISHSISAHLDPGGNDIDQETLRELAILHGKACDYQKSGIPVHHDEIPRPSSVPHYMDGHKHISKRVLGKMFDACVVPAYPTLKNHDTEMIKILSTSKHYQNYTKDAQNHYTSYKKEMKGIMKEFGFEEESEVIVGKFVLKSKTSKTSKTFKRIDYEVELANECTLLILKYQRIFGEVSNSVNHHDVAVAWYSVAYQDREAFQCLSFAWINASSLVPAKSK